MNEGQYILARRKENEEKQEKGRKTKTKQENFNHDWYGVLFYGV